MAHWSLGVDLGTSFSAGAIATADRVELLEVGGERRVPSTVLLAEDGQLLAGTFAQRMVGRYPDRAERNPKRYVGRGPMLLGGESIPAQQALAALLDLFVTEARRRFDGSQPASVVLTHPVAWSTDRRDLLRDAADQVLPDVEVHLLDEPVASAVHYAHQHGLRAGDTAAVYDLGGGTFDTAVLTATRTGFRVVGRPGGDPDIGGESFDERVYAHFGTQLEHLAPDWWEQVRTDPARRWLAAAADLLTEARLGKEALSRYDSASQYISGADVDVHITRTELDELIGEDVRRTAALLAEAIESSQRSPDQLRGIFLTGGASRTRLVEQTLRPTYGDLVRTWEDPKTVVALGAARWGAHHDQKTNPPPGAPEPATSKTATSKTATSETGTSETGAPETVALQPMPTWNAPGPAWARTTESSAPGRGATEAERSWRWWAPAISLVSALLVAGALDDETEVGFAIQLLVFAPFTGVWIGLLVRPRLLPQRPRVAPFVGALLWALLTFLLILTWSDDDYYYGPDGEDIVIFTGLLWLPAVILLVRWIFRKVVEPVGEPK